MTVGVISQPTQYPGNGSATTFNYPALISAASDLIVGFIVGGVYTRQLAGYTIPSSGLNNAGGCQVVFGTAPPGGTTVDLRSLLPQTQPTNFSNLGAYQPESTTAAVDRAVREIKDLARLTYLFGIHGPDTESTPWPALPPAAQRLGFSLVFDPVQGLPALGAPTATVAAITQALIMSVLGSSGAGQLLYPLTVVEQVSGATVVNYAYPSGSVDRYGNNTVPGTTSMVAAFNAAIAQCMAGGSKVTYGLTGTYLLDSPVNGTVTGQPNEHGLTIENIAGAGADSPVYNIVAKHTGQSVFDFTGNDSVVLRDVNITTDAVTYPATGILTARNASKGSLLFRAENCKVQGHFSVSCFYNYGSEDDVLSGCYFRNDATTAGTKTRVYTGSNISGITSPFTTIASGQVSCIDHNDFGCLDFNQAGTTTSDCIYLEASDSFKKVGGWAYNASATTDGRALIYVDTNGGTTTCNFCSIKGMTSEQATALQRYFLLFGTGAVTHVGWSVDATKMPNAIAAIACIDSTVTLDNFSLIAGNLGSGGGISIPGTLQNSPAFNYGNEITSVVIGTSNKNTLIGESANLTVTTRTHDYWIDTGIGNKSFAPGIATGVNGWTAVGAITQSASYLLSGGIAYFSITVFGATSIACTSGATITTLPFASAMAGEAFVSDLTARTLIGIGLVNSKTITMPAVTTNINGIIMKGWYFVA